MEELLRRDLRANPLYELVLYDRLPPAQRETLADLRTDPAFYGVLQPRAEGKGLAVRSVDGDTALLFLTLRLPGPLPDYARAALGVRCREVVARLVADAVLEIDDGGGFVSGAAAAHLLSSGAPEGGGRLAELSRAALRYAQALAVDDPALLAFRLYRYNALPLAPRWQRLLPTADAVRDYLGLGPGGDNRKALDRRWQPGSSPRGWLSWWRARPAGPAPDDEQPTYKLYVSLAPDALPGLFGEVVEALAAGGAFQLKVGADAWGLLRADKVVAYLPDRERLAATAEALAARLAGAPAQGVPFTAEIGGRGQGGLLSWGLDPPAAERDLPWQERQSWRQWLAGRLARALLAARAAAAPGVEPWRFALERVGLEGVDAGTWTPGARLFREAP